MSQRASSASPPLFCCRLTALQRQQQYMLQCEQEVWYMSEGTHVMARKVVMQTEERRRRNEIRHAMAARQLERHRRESSHGPC